MDRSLFLARLIGPTFVAIALGMLINLSIYERMIAEALRPGTLLYLSGVLSLLAGLAIIQWSSNRGKTWFALGSLLKGNQATFDAMSLPTGRIELRLLVSDGFHTTRSATVNVRIPPQAPMVCIMTPRQRGTVIAGEKMRLWGAVTVPGDERVYQRAKATWYIDNRRVGDGLDLFVVAPPKWRHRARLNVSVKGRRAEASAEFQSANIPSADEAAKRRLPS